MYQFQREDKQEQTFSWLRAPFYSLLWSLEGKKEESRQWRLLQEDRFKTNQQYYAHSAQQAFFCRSTTAVSFPADASQSKFADS